jgi:hypothetical protein
VKLWREKSQVRIKINILSQTRYLSSHESPTMALKPIVNKEQLYLHPILGVREEKGNW